MPKRKKEDKPKPMDETNAGPLYSSDFQKTSPREFLPLHVMWAAAAEQALAEIGEREDIDGRSGAFRGVSLRSCCEISQTEALRASNKLRRKPKTGILREREHSVRNES
jgi:hypothetical protein